MLIIARDISADFHLINIQRTNPVLQRTHFDM